MTPDKLAAELGKGLDAYHNHLLVIGELFSETRLKPLLRRKNWKFLAGNGAWVVVDCVTDKPIYNDHPDWDAECEEVMAMLEFGVCEDRFTFGSMYINDFDPNK